ncbi:MAG TPA: hypothetical protein VFN44_16880 [Solirubrobacteraceae bacterium]|nr:hypothetical protein [Solirubrobacteraceae bacterium]
MRGRIWVVAALALVLAPAATADAATYCVGVRATECTARDTAADAFAAARADAERDTILLGRLSEAGPFADATGRPVRVIGLGADLTRLRPGASGPTLRLLDPGSSARMLRIDGGASAPALQIDDGAEIASSAIEGRVRLRGGTAELSSVLVDSPGPGVEITCETATARVTFEHVTVRGSGDAGVAGSCATAGRTIAVTVADSIVWGSTRGFDLDAGSLSAAYSDFPEATGDANIAADPRFTAPADARPQPGSPVLDAGRPGALSDTEPPEDALGFVRIADGTGDGALRRDMGALELQPPAPGAVMGNALANPGAEAGTPAEDDTSSPAPPQWSRTGAFTFVRYGTVVGNFPFPSRQIGEALGSGEAFFTAGPGKGNTATQLVDVSDAAPEIDLGEGSAAVSALLGGYRASPDGAIVEAEFRGPDGRALGHLQIGPVTAADRGGATNLLPRSAAGAMPPLTRTVAVILRSVTAMGGYDDAYFDSVALVPRVSGGAPHRDPTSRAGGRMRPFSGVAVVSRRAAVDRRRRTWVRLACATRVVGRCTGTVTVTARITRSGERRVARRGFTLRRGRVKRISIPLSKAGRRAVAAKRRLRGHVYVAARDGQGLTRTSSSPARLVRGGGFRRR